MRQVITALIALTCLAFLGSGAVQAQLPNTASIGFNNKTDLNVIIQGYTIVNGSKKYGSPLQLRKNGSKGFESNVPGGVRFYTICDANNQARVLLRDVPVPIQAREIYLEVVVAPNGRIFIKSAQ